MLKNFTDDVIIISIPKIFFIHVFTNKELDIPATFVTLTMFFPEQGEGV